LTNPHQEVKLPLFKLSPREIPETAALSALSCWVQIERDGHQEAHVQPLKRGICLQRVLHNRVMIHPQHADGQEGDDVADVRRPCVVDRVTNGRSGRICDDIKDQYGRRNGEHYVGEDLNSVRLHLQEISVDADRKCDHLTIPVLVWHYRKVSRQRQKQVNEH